MSSTVCRFAWNASKSKFLVSVAAAAMLAACSADADRFTAGSSGADPVQTASVPGGMNAANVGLDDKVSSKPLASTTSQPPSYNYAQPYKAPAYRQPAVAVATAPEAAAPRAATASGSTVTVGPGMTLYSLARANNLSVSQLAAANGIKPPYSVHTGQVLRIPEAAARRPKWSLTPNLKMRRWRRHGNPSRRARRSARMRPANSTPSAPAKRSIRWAANMASRPSPSPMPMACRIRRNSPRARR